jgi:hypothetical protein
MIDEFKPEMVTFKIMGSFPSQVLAGHIAIGTHVLVVGGFSSEEIIEKCRIHYYDMMVKKMIENENNKTYTLCTTTKQK